jgi:hypothetical protein
MATIDSQALRIQANSYTGIRGYAQELVRAVNQNDTSIIGTYNIIVGKGGNGIFGGSLIGDFNMSSQQVYSYGLAYNDATIYLRTNGGSGAVAMTNSVFTNTSVFYYQVTYQTA